MNRQMHTAFIALVFLFVSSHTLAQSVPDTLFACLDGNGNLYGVTPTGKLGEGCSSGDLPVSLGSAGQVNASNGLVGNITNGVVDIGVAPGLAIPPSCPPGQIPISDGQGAWICTLPNLGGVTNPGAKVWIIPRLFTAPNGFDEILFVNPSRTEARARCYQFLSDGLNTAVVDGIVVPAGGQGRCTSQGRVMTDSDFRYIQSWGLLVSDTPVLPTAYGSAFFAGGRNTYNRVTSIEAYPVDCNNPEGYEFVCEYAFD